MKKVLILANPNSGIERRQKLALKKLVKKLEKERISYQIFQKVEDIPLTIIDQSVDRLIVLGGDGTISFAARFLYRNNIDLPIAIIPVGSGNVFAQALKISLIIRKAIKTALFGSPKKIPLGQVNNNEIFITGVTTGLHADLMNGTPRWSKRIIGTVAYYLKLPFHLFRIKKHHYTLTLPNQAPFRIKASAVFVLSGLPRVGGEPLNRMDPLKPMLYTLVLEIAKPSELARAFSEVFILRKKPKNKVHYFETKSVILETKHALLTIDGEMTSKKKLKISIASKPMRFLLPK